MADSNITKKALAAALKTLMAKTPYSKISIGDICELCEMNRKSFYYHFKDKADLVNWIFDSEYQEEVKNAPCDSSRNELSLLVNYFYDNRAFYKKALKIEGQNSLSDHLTQVCYPVIQERLQHVMKTENVSDFQVRFFSDGIIHGIKRWLTARECLSPDVFIDQIQSCVFMAAKHICYEMNESTDQKTNRELTSST